MKGRAIERRAREIRVRLGLSGWVDVDWVARQLGIRVDERLYVFTMSGSAETALEAQKTNLRVLGGGLFPCIFAYAFTRVVYGVEVLVES